MSTSSMSQDILKARALALCDHVERFAYERQGVGLDASPHMLSAATRQLVSGLLSESTKSALPRAWSWWSGASDEWYEHGPFETREQALAELGGAAGYIVEALPAGDVSFDAASLIEAQYLEDNDDFDFDHCEPDRTGPAATIAAADAELQALLNGWCARHADTFLRGNLFAATRNGERVDAVAQDEIVGDQDGSQC